jgi:hypothetical protein
VDTKRSNAATLAAVMIRCFNQFPFGFYASKQQSVPEDVAAIHPIDRTIPMAETDPPCDPPSKM